MELVNAFLTRSSDWDGAEAALVALRERQVRSVDATSTALQAVAGAEVGFVYDLWKGNLRGALERGRALIPKLSGGNDLRPYRAWWNYLTGSVAQELGKREGNAELVEVARQLFQAATEASHSITWFSNLARRTPGTRDTELDLYSAFAVERVQQLLVDLGHRGPKFDKEARRLSDEIGSNDAKAFESGLQRLGRMLGFDAETPTGSGQPDGVWDLDGRTFLVFEAKSNEGSEGGISLTTLRETGSHVAWLTSNRRIPSSAEIIPILISPRTRVDDAARHAAGDIRYWSLSSVRAATGVAIAALQRVRTETPSAAAEATRERILEEFRRDRIDPVSLLEGFRRSSLPGLTVKPKGS